MDSTIQEDRRFGLDKYSDIKNKILDFAKNDDTVKAVIAIGSTTRNDVKADEYSDLDLFIVTSNTEPWFSGEYPERFGNVSISFIEPTLGGGRERRCIYDEDKDVDMIILTPEQFETAVRDGVAEWVMNRGYSVLYDVMDYEVLLKTNIKLGCSNPEIDAAEFNNMVNDFYFHNIWAFKKLKRGELWAAKMCVDSYLKNYLLKMIEMYRYKTAGVDVWHDGRFIDRWAGENITKELRKSFAHYDEEDVKSALIATQELFEGLSVEYAQIEGFEYPEKARECAKAYIGNNKR